MDSSLPRTAPPSPELCLCDGTVFAREWGAANRRTLLCWHGAGGSSGNFERIAPALASGLHTRVVAIDGPGHARSAPRPPEEFLPSVLAALAVRILDELRVKRAIFVGFSWGASVGCRLAALHPERVEALVLVEGGHLDFDDLPGFDTGRTLEELVEGRGRPRRARGRASGATRPRRQGP